MNKVTDMNGVEIKVGQKVFKHGLLNKRCKEPLIRTVKGIQPMHGGGEPMIWFTEGGGAHHPKAVEVMDAR